MLDTQAVLKRIEMMRAQAIERDERQRQILAMRDNDYEAIAAGLLPEDFNKPLVANLIDTAAHDLAEVMAPLPSISCASASQTADTQKKFANKRALIANSYVQRSRLSDQMYLGADRYSTFGWFAYVVEPDLQENVPYIRVDSSLSTYFVCDYRDRVAQYVSVMNVPASDLCLMFPDFAQAINEHVRFKDDSDIEIAEWRDKDRTVVVLPELKLELHSVENVLGRVPVRIVKRPNIRANETKGQFDDVIWVQYGRALVAAYTMSAVQQSVEAPIALPKDVQVYETGPNSTISSDNPERIGRIPLNVPSGLFPEQSILAQEQRVGSRYPEGRSGNIDASIITGQGVQALMGTFDTQIQTFHRLNASALEDVISMCFEMDQALWPELERSVRVKDAGSPVEIKYRPSKDIKSDYSVDVSYGAVAGLDPNRSLIFILQGISGGLISRETGREHMPVDLDQVVEAKRIDNETLRESLVGAMAALAQAIPQMAASGQDPRDVVEQISQIMLARERGDSIEQAVAKTFAPKQKAQPEQMTEQQMAEAALSGGAPPEGGPPGGPQIEGPPSPGQNLLMGLAGLTPSGSANLQSNVSTRAIAK